jgi:hypothetical protein
MAEGDVDGDVELQALLHIDDMAVKLQQEVCAC